MSSVPISLEVAIFAALVVFVGYLIFGVTGFGASPITIPLLAHVLPLVFVLPLASILDLGSALALAFHTRRQADTRELLTLVPFTLVGLTLGVTLLVSLPRNATLLALGMFVCAYAVYVLVRRQAPRRLTRWWAAPAGLAGGVVGALFGMGGPPYVMYITGRVPDPAAQRATISQMVILNVGLRVVAFALAGLLLSRALWIAVTILLPMAWIGVWVGNRLHVRAAPATVARVVAAALLLTGVTLIARTL
ncbi:MAG TPA: sulfite exporter TauE/SafE family protein [Methylomirabilota bacterium]|nr:sulfite exporter TauE/SafE family protein [Methylomirabilota bacterium]